jgi:hypothetical protein
MELINVEDLERMARIGSVRDGLGSRDDAGGD